MSSRLRANEHPAGSIASTPTMAPARPSTRTRLSMSVINFWLDSFLLVLTTLLGGVSAMIRIVFPAPTRAEGWRLWGWNIDQWYDVQFACLCILGLGVLLHVTLHWNWVCGVVSTQILRAGTRVDESMKTIYGVGLLIIILHMIAGGVILAMFCVERPPT